MKRDFSLRIVYLVREIFYRIKLFRKGMLKD
jgi:hypothetical protein